MDVVKEDIVIYGMLNEELERCHRMAAALSASISLLPKGSIHQRNLKQKGKVYVSYFRKFREEGKSVYSHVPKSEVDSFKEKIADRKRKSEELKKIKNRINYLNKLLKR